MPARAQPLAWPALPCRWRCHLPFPGPGRGRGRGGELPVFAPLPQRGGRGLRHALAAEGSGVKPGRGGREGWSFSSRCAMLRPQADLGPPGACRATETGREPRGSLPLHAAVRGTRGSRWRRRSGGPRCFCPAFSRPAFFFPPPSVIAAASAAVSVSGGRLPPRQGLPGAGGVGFLIPPPPGDGAPRGRLSRRPALGLGRVPVAPCRFSPGAPCRPPPHPAPSLGARRPPDRREGGGGGEEAAG